MYGTIRRYPGVTRYAASFRESGAQRIEASVYALPSVPS
jgi:hypothetical protein